MSTDLDAEHPTGLPVRIRLLACVLGCAVGAFVVCTALYNFPESTVKSRIDPTVNALVLPWFEQDWQLFAPTPPTSNTQLLVTVRVRSEEGTVRELPPFDAQYPIDELHRSNHVMPNKLAEVTLTAQQRMASYARDLAVILGAPETEQAAMHTALDARYHATLDEIGRFMSRCAQDRFGSARIVAVRGTFTTTPITPFSQRDLTNPAPQTPTTIATTSWDPFIADVSD